VVTAGELAAAGALLAGALELEELAPEEQAASEAPTDMAHRIPATDRVVSFIFWSLCWLMMTGKMA
jgi:hypothetical protein